jgi:uncharacterized protein YbaP (TraB family)
MAIVHLLVGASIAATPLPAAPPISAPAYATSAPLRQHPALWVVNDKDTVIYLFGTFHALDGKSQWFEQAVKTAFSASDQLMLETLVPDSLRRPVPAPPPIPTLTRQSGPWAKLAPSASSMLASSRTVMTAGRSEGMSTDRGADAVLRDAADRSGKPVAGFESFQFQLSMFNSLQSTPQPQPPQDARAIRALGNVLSNLESAWNRGDVDTAFTPLLMQMEAQSPQTYKTMFVERNARWARWIADRLKTPGTVFVAVGAGHLSGPDSVQNQLAAIGVKSARIN